MRLGVVDADLERARARPDREVGIAELRRDGARGLLAVAQVTRQALRHPAELVVEALEVADVARERLLARDRDALDRDLERPRVDAAGPFAHDPADLAGQRGARARRRSSAASVADRLDAGRREPLLGPRPDPGQHADRAAAPGTAASPPGRTTVSPPGLRRSEAIFATTFELPTPSEQDSRVRARTTARTASATARASSKELATSPSSR